VSIDLLGYVVLGSYWESFARWADQRALGELIELHTNPPRIFMMADQEWELNHHLWDEEVGPTDPITHFLCIRAVRVACRRWSERSVKRRS